MYSMYSMEIWINYHVILDQNIIFFFLNAAQIALKRIGHIKQMFHIKCKLKQKLNNNNEEQTLNQLTSSF